MDEKREPGLVEAYLLALRVYGKRNAITRISVAGGLGFKPNKHGARKVSRLLEKEREAGALILSDGSGVYLPSRVPAEARREVEHYLRFQSAKAKSHFRSLRPARRFLKKLDGQTTFEDLETEGGCV